jgi:hypothetical protein
MSSFYKVNCVQYAFDLFDCCFVMLKIYLTDTQTHIQFSDIPNENPVKFLLNLKKYFLVQPIYYYLYYLKTTI